VQREAPIQNPATKLANFGWDVIEIDGHDIDEILAGCQSARQSTDVPTAIVAHTVKGKGVSFMEGHYAWHSKPITDEDLQNALAELDGSGGGTPR
jgi:transketolase